MGFEHQEKAYNLSHPNPRCGGRAAPECGAGAASDSAFGIWLAMPVHDLFPTGKLIKRIIFRITIGLLIDFPYVRPLSATCTKVHVDVWLVK